MIHTLRRKFMIVSMSVVTIVLIAILGTINLYNLKSMHDSADQILQILSENQGTFPMRKPEEGEKKPGERPLISEETPYESRYFTVIFENDTVLTINTRNTISVDQSQALTYAETVLQDNRSKGSYADFRYAITQHNGLTYVIFLDQSRSLHTFYGTLKTSATVAGISLVSIAVLLYFASSLAIAPIVESDRRQKQFITDASHELKTPLTIISADVDLLEMEQGETEWSKDLKEQSARMKELTESLIMLARMDEGNTHMNFVDLPLSDVLEETIQLFHASALTHHLHIISDIAPMLSMHADSGAITRLCSILMDNAIKYAKENTDIHAQLKKDGHDIHLIITNISESDLSEHDLHHLFDRFYRPDASRNSSTGGSGLGLAMAKEIVQAHKGTIKAEMHDHALTIHITFPF